LAIANQRDEFKILFDGQRWLALANAFYRKGISSILLVGQRWPALASAGKRWPSQFIGKNTCDIYTHQLALASDG